MSFNTFCGQDSTNPATYQRVLLRFQEGGGGGGIAAVNQGPNITIANPAIPVVQVANPLNATLNMGAQSLTDSAGNIGAIGDVLGCGAAGGQTLWGPAGAAGNPVVNTTNANALLFPTLVTAGGGLPRQLFADDGATPISVNPFTGEFNVSLGLTSNTNNTNVGIGAGVAAAAQSVAIGPSAGNNGQGAGAVAVGYEAGRLNQSLGGVAIGENAADQGQGQNAVAVGSAAGNVNQGNGAVAIGSDAGNNGQGAGAIAIGLSCGQLLQGADAIAIGNVAAGSVVPATAQGASAIAIGLNAGNSNQGANAIAIGEAAGFANQIASSICLNATAAVLNAPTASLYVAPIINSGAIADPVPLATNFLLYNPATAEITYGDGAGIGAGGANFPVAFVPYFNELALPQTTLPINDGAGGLYTTADLIRGNINPTVAMMYDPAAVVANPSITPNYVEVEIHLEMVNLKNQFALQIPTDQLLNDTVNNSIGTLIGGSNCAPNALVYHWTYTTPTTPPGTYLDFDVPQFYSSIYTEIPTAIGTVYAAQFGNQAFSTQFSGRTLLNLTGAAPADIYNFQLWAYTQDSGTGPPKVVDTSTIKSFGLVSIKTSMFRL